MHLRTPRWLGNNGEPPPIYTTIHHQRSRYEGATLGAGPKQPDHIFAKTTAYKNTIRIPLKTPSNVCTQAAKASKLQEFNQTFIAQSKSERRVDKLKKRIKT